MPCVSTQPDSVAAPQATMEIDPRLHAGRDRDAHTQSPGHAAVGGSTNPGTGTGTSTSSNTNTNTHPRTQNALPYTPVAGQLNTTTGPPSQPPTGEYPDPPPSSHFSPSEQLHSASSAPSSGRYYPSPAAYASDAPRGGEAASNPHDPNDPFADQKRPRACEACRQLKVRCEPDARNPAGTCKRCAKAGRQCVVTAPTRKRQKKTDSRVAELERKIDALTASLQASQGHELLLQGAPPPPPQQQQRDVHEQPGRRWLGGAQNGSGGMPPSGPAGNLAGNKRCSSGEVKESREGGSMGSGYPRASSPAREPARENGPSKHWRGPWSSLQPGSRSEASSAEVVDVIDRGLVSLAVASEAFDRYINDRAPHMPFVVFPPGTTMGDVRKSKPTLLHAIIASSVGPVQPDAHLMLLDDLYRVLAERVIVKGEKSLELVQALVVACHWYTPPDHFEELKFYHLTHMAVTLAMDLGMNRKMLTRNKPFPIYKELVRKSSFMLDPDSPETRRTWLGCYFMAVQVALSLRRVLLVRWQPYMDECLEILEKSPAALPSDKAVIQWAKLAHLTEDINFQFSTEEAVPSMPFDDPKVQYTLKVFEKQLEQWKREVLPEIYSSIMQQAEHIVNIYMYENAMLIDSVDDQRKAGEEYPGTISAAHMSALSQCLSSIQQALDAICSNDIKDLISWPTVCLARASFAAVSLIKLYSLVTFPGSQIGQVIDPASLKVEYYLNKVIEHYSAAGELPGGRTPGRFSMVLAMLRSWFVKRKDHNQVLREAFGAGPVSCSSFNLGASEADKAQLGQTRLHLLSEVAMKDPNNRPTTSNPPHHRPSYASHSSTDPITHSPSPNLPSTSQPISSSRANDSDPWSPYSSSTPTQPQNVSAPAPAPAPAPNRQFYPPFTNYQDMPPYSDSASLIMPPMNQGFFIPELGMQVGFDTGNMFALEQLLGEGLLNLPLPAEAGGTGYY
ncbi:putative C6 transcription factor (War1) [Aspergillus clavatus NRRL 1]|uniref:C6 transcription factor, putative n=1 Tax=Aspergillus clavatus (strain ATCC 1007 / CBS 513.65 / DSM 816 / NCTC 3887 / NRRL 1 / QM 1276 / 107) TaxID=344612 RepID=A1CG78_ASPCL|nr:C6 transcription factor, putative [Aspergillus clavatus NRRL 1]EAW10958.1 C6 transcription factor, putative [Aspergillus clavatus NRRL 1]